MKKLFALVFLSIGLFSKGIAGSNGTPIAVVSGKMNEFKSGEMILYKAEDGKRAKYATYQKKKDKQFAFAIPLNEAGLYYLSDQSSWFYIRLYLKPGEHVELNVNYSGMYEIVKGSAENKLLHQWFKKVAVISIPSFNTSDTTTYRSFFPNAKKLIPQAAEFKKTIRAGNAAFNKILNQIVNIDVEYAAFRFCFTPRSISPSPSELSDFLRQFVKPEKYCNAGLLSLGESIDLLGLYVTANFMLSSDQVRDSIQKSLQKRCSFFCNDTIKGAFIVSGLSRYRFYDEFTVNVSPVKQYLLTSVQLEAYDEKLKQFDTLLRAGKPSLNFQLPDISGKKVAMSDLKGKIVLVDVWATWCVPCRAEIPHLKKLEEELGLNVVFVSISVDKKEDREKWTKFVEKEQLGGIQLFAGEDKSFDDFYKVNAIPRFMVFDKEGKIVDVDAARPSEPELKTLLYNLIQQ
jgi:thiol-disulfide isomerase/thioredoxin